MPFARPNDDEQRRYWAGIRRRRDPSHPAVAAFAAAKLAYIRAALPEGAATMLEVGAGNGYFSRSFAEAFALTALDLSANMLAMNPLPAARKVQGSAEALPFADEAFDVVFSGNLLHHLETPAIAVREMARVARRHVVLLEPNALNPAMLLFGLAKRAERGVVRFSPGYLRSLGLGVGMRLRASTSFGGVLPNRTPRVLVPVARLLERPLPLGLYTIAIFDVGRPVRG
ncbi:MAG: class I SAM-dependent methyltransferase [Myxococcales bacterium]|nr:class I SAM-dependent methyltransferase [Myxococcales bacterium]